MSIEERSKESSDRDSQEEEDRPSDLTFMLDICGYKEDEDWSDDCELIGEEVADRT